MIVLWIIIGLLLYVFLGMVTYYSIDHNFWDGYNRLPPELYAVFWIIFVPVHLMYLIIVGWFVGMLYLAEWAGSKLRRK